MRNKFAEEKLMNVAKTYRQRMTVQRDRTHAEDTPEKVKEKINRRLNFAPIKDKNLNEEIRYNKNIMEDHKRVNEMDKSKLRTPNQPNHMYNIEKETSEYIQSSQNSEQNLHRTRQSKNKVSHCVISHRLKCEEKTEMDDAEEVIYSEGEPFEGYRYPKNTWDSDDSLYDEDYS